MRNKNFLLTATFLFIITSFAYGYERVDTTGKTGKITLILQGIKTEQANKSVAESNLNKAQNSLNAEKPDLEKKRDEKYKEANDLFVKYNNIYPEGSPQ